MELESEVNIVCRFCTKPDKHRILFQTENFYIMLSLGPITEGYLLLITKEHISCCASIPSNIFSEFIKLYNRVRDVLIEEYGNCISFEHGRAGVCSVPLEGSKHCYHAHMHFVPVNSNISLNAFVQRDYDNIEFDDLNDFKKMYSTVKSPYLYVHDMELNFYEIDKMPRRQYLRYKISVLLEKRDSWDWVAKPNFDLIEQARNKLIKYFK